MSDFRLFVFAAYGLSAAVLAVTAAVTWRRYGRSRRRR